MTTPTDQRAPKVHPLSRGIEPDDPLELVAEPVEGDPDVMLECLILEFAAMGYESEQLLAMFQSPFYPVLNLLLEHHGAEEIERRVEALVQRAGVFRVRETISEDPELEDEAGPELVQLNQWAPDTRPHSLRI
jgi:hypothetical protein